jgi:hypothetical protein
MWLLVVAALAGPPEGVDPSEASTWDEAWNPLFEGPAGCWEVVGRATWDWSFGKAGAAHGDAVFVGRLDDGVWSNLYTRSLGETVERRHEVPVRVYPHGEQHFVPMIGKRVGEWDEIRGEADTETLLDAVFDEIGTGVDYSYTEWDDDTESVVLHRMIPIGEGNVPPQAEMRVWFPDGGLIPTYGRIDFPESFSVPGIPLAKVRMGEARVRGRVAGGLVFPEAESFQFKAGFLGFKVEGAQTVQYKTFRPCGGAVETEAKPILPGSPP